MGEALAAAASSLYRRICSLIAIRHRHPPAVIRTDGEDEEELARSVFVYWITCWKGTSCPAVSSADIDETMTSYKPVRRFETAVARHAGV